MKKFDWKLIGIAVILLFLLVMAEVFVNTTKSRKETAPMSAPTPITNKDVFSTMNSLEYLTILNIKFSNNNFRIRLKRNGYRIEALGEGKVQSIIEDLKDERVWIEGRVKASDAEFERAKNNFIKDVGRNVWEKLEKKYGAKEENKQ